jgi:hypothetical protein
MSRSLRLMFYRSNSFIRLPSAHQAASVIIVCAGSSDRYQHHCESHPGWNYGSSFITAI